MDKLCESLSVHNNYAYFLSRTEYIFSDSNITITKVVHYLLTYFTQLRHKQEHKLAHVPWI